VKSIIQVYNNQETCGMKHLLCSNALMASCRGYKIKYGLQISLDNIFFVWFVMCDILDPIDYLILFLPKSIIILWRKIDNNNTNEINRLDSFHNTGLPKCNYQKLCLNLI